MKGNTMEEKLLAAKSGAVNMLYAAQQVLALANGTSQFAASRDLITAFVKTLGQRIGEFESTVAPMLDVVNAANCDASIVSIAGISGETAHSVAGKIGFQVYHVCRNVVIHRHRKPAYEDIRETGGPGWEELLPNCWEDARRLLQGVEIDSAWMARIGKEYQAAIAFSPSSAPDSAPDTRENQYLFRDGLPEDTDLIDLAVRLHSRRAPENQSDNELAREWHQTKGPKLLQTLRNWKTKGKIRPWPKPDGNGSER